MAEKGVMSPPVLNHRTTTWTWIIGSPSSPSFSNMRRNRGLTVCQICGTIVGRVKEVSCLKYRPHRRKRLS